MIYYDLPDGWHTIGDKKLRIKDQLIHYSNGPAVILKNPFGGHDHYWYDNGRCFGMNSADGKSFYTQEQFETDRSFKKSMGRV